MANVQQYVEQILSARFGEEVRGSIANSILAMNDEAVEAHEVAIDSQTSSQKNAQAAQLSADNAKDSETKAKTSELNAKDSETKAKASEVNAKTSEDNAKASELASKVSETNAKTSEGNAKTSETNAKTSETSANDSMRSALQSASSASASASAASASQTASANSASAAKTSEDNARQYAQQASAIANIDVATVSRNGISRPDGSTIGINQFGVISALGLTEHINTNLDDENGVHGTRIYTIPETGKQILQKWDEESSDWVDVAGALDPATKDTIGGVIIGDGIDVDGNGKISVTIPEVDKATKDKAGIVQIGDGIDVADGTISIPTATANKAGIVKIGNGINVTDGTISVDNTDVDMSVVSDAWDITKVYNVGDYCIHNNVLYKCLVQNTGSEPTEGNSNWEKCSVGAELSQINSNFIGISQTEDFISNPTMLDQTGLEFIMPRNGYFFAGIRLGKASATTISINDIDVIDMFAGNTSSAISQTESQIVSTGALPVHKNDKVKIYRSYGQYAWANTAKLCY